MWLMIFHDIWGILSYCKNIYLYISDGIYIFKNDNFENKFIYG